MIERWPKTRTRPVYTTSIFELRVDTRRSPRGALRDFYVLEAPDWVNVVPLTASREVVMVLQPRFGIEAVTLEVPGGMVDPEDRSPRDTAARELLEETGYAPEELNPIGFVHPNPAMQNNRTFSFVARNCRRLTEPRPDEGEDIEVVVVPLWEIPDRIARGEITHALVVSAFYHLFAREGWPAQPEG